MAKVTTYSGREGWRFCFSLITAAIINSNCLAPGAAGVIDTNKYAEQVKSLCSEENYLASLDAQQVNCWPVSRLPIKVFVSHGDKVAGYKPVYMDYLNQALRQWTEASAGQIHFIIVEKPTTEGLEIGWKARSGDYHGGEAGEARVDVDDYGIKNAKVDLFTFPDDKHNYQDAAAMLACLHELGHALGMPGHSQAADDIMCPKYRLDSGATAGSVRLSDRDNNTLRAMIQLGPQHEEEPLAANHPVRQPSHNSNNADVASTGNAGSPDGASPGNTNLSNDAILRHNELVDLNNSASADIINRNFQAAIGKLEQCHQADPTYTTAESNLEIAYYNWAVQLYQRHDYSNAVDVLTKGLSCLDSQQHPEKKHLVEVLQIYAASLHQLGNDAEAQRAEARVDQISVGD